MRVNSIRFRITAISVVAILVAIILIFASSYNSIRNETNRRSVEEMRLIGKDTKNTLDEYFESIEQSVGMAANMAVDSLDSVTLVQCGAAGSRANEPRTPQQTARLDAYIEEHCVQTLSTFESVASHTNGVIAYYYCINPEISQSAHGFYYSRFGKAGFVAQPPLDASTFDPSDANHSTWYYTPIQHGRPCWVGPFHAHYPEEIWACSYVVPIYSTGALIGVLGMDIPLDTLAAQVSPIKVYDTGYASLCDADARILYHPNLPQWTSPHLTDLSVSQELLRNEDSGDALIRYSFGDEERQMSFFTLRNGMKLVITAPVKEINAPWIKLVHRIYFITAAVIAVFAVIIMIVMRVITFPLHQLTDAAQRLADADYDVALDYHKNDEIGKLTGAFLKMRNQIKNYIEDLNRRINTDMLTGLPNMRCFFRLAVTERRRLLNEGKAPAMLYFDLVGMKHYNRQYGFKEGDHLLCDVGQILVRFFGEKCVCRYSEDHFAAVTDEASAEAVLAEVFKACEGANGGNSLPVRVGIYRNSIENAGVNVACDRAKFACDRHNDSYASGFYYFDEAMLDQLDGVRYIINHLDQALAEGWIQVYYQPIVRAVNGRVCDEEALCRWIDPVKGMLSPALFVPILETARLMYRVDLYVLDRILEKMHAQRELGLQVVPHSLNLSRADFDACDIVEEIRRRVDDAGIARDRLTIEITESIIGSDFDFIKEQILRFQALGFQVWMDDFGSGYSSLNVLQDIHFDLVKFDMLFLKSFYKGDESKVILTDLIRMAIDLGVDTVCEGVETAEEVEFLREVGCSKLQGYYYSRPNSFETILERYRTGTAIGFENPEEAEYYAAIGRVNLFDITVIADTESTRKDYFNTLPAGILEVTDSELDYARTNPAYRNFIKRYFDFDLAARPDGYSVSPEGPPAMFLKLVRQCSAEGNRTLYDDKLADGSKVHGVMNPVGTNPVTGATAVAIAILSISAPDKSTTYADIARALAADYYNIYVIDLDTDDFIEYSSRVGGEELAVERHGSDFFESAKRDTMTRIYEEDRAAFLAWFSKENILRELREQGVFTATYRLIDTGAPLYANMKITRMPGGNRIIVGISIIDSQMKQKKRQEELQKERDMMIRVMALSDDYLSLYTVDPDTGRFIEYSSSDDYDTLGVAKEGSDFFGQSIANADRYFYPDDIPAFRRRFTMENVMREIRKNGSFKTQYRLMINGVPQPVTLKAALFNEGEEQKLVVGVRAWRRQLTETCNLIFDDEYYESD
ncbi:MAG: EAL domain-containing protein [Clostridia bacterium]|nr:EAL domain-containing protein [Clostridia bacterium]